MKIYVDSKNFCHATNPDGSFLEVETDFFDDKYATSPCTELIEGYCCEIKENSISFYPWKDYNELDNAQRAYGRQLLAEYTEALKIMGVTV